MARKNVCVRNYKGNHTPNRANISEMSFEPGQCRGAGYAYPSTTWPPEFENLINKRKNQSKIHIDSSLKKLAMRCLCIIVVQVVRFSSGGYKIGNIFP